jgi:hypothetical protein
VSSVLVVRRRATFLHGAEELVDVPDVILAYRIWQAQPPPDAPEVFE